MKTKSIAIGIVLFALCLSAFAQGTAFTYQGRLNSSGAPAGGSYDFTFQLFNASTNGSQAGPTLTNAATAINSDGLFTVLIDFGTNIFNGTPYWLQVAVRTNGSGAFIPLSPRQAVTPTPYAIFAENAGNASGSAGVSSVTGNADITAVPTTGNVVLGTTATSGNFGSTIVKRNGSGDFAAQTITLGGNLQMPLQPLQTNVGIIYFGAATVLHAYGLDDFFCGVDAGNLTHFAFGNTGIGNHALNSLTTGSFNTANGIDALRNNTTASHNTASGYQALYSNTTGSENTADGLWSLYSNTNGSGNTAIGREALYSNTSGGDNTACGYQALYANLTGNHNAANGQYALHNNTNGGFNTAEGYNALSSNLSGNGNIASGAGAAGENINGSFNVAVGSGALPSNTSGNNNIAIGNTALPTVATGSENIAIGNMAGSGVSADGYNNIYIGSSGLANDYSVIRIGNAQTNTYIAGIWSFPIFGTPVTVTGNGALGTATSSRRFKDDIRSMADASEILYSLEPVTFRYKPSIDPKGLPQFGLVAEEVEKVDPDLVVHDEHNRAFSVRYDAVNAMLLNEFIKEHKTVVEQNEEIENLKQQHESLEKQLHELAEMVESLREGR